MKLNVSYDKDLFDSPEKDESRLGQVRA